MFAGDSHSAGGETRTHTRLPSPGFESDKVCAMVRDSALRSAFMSLFAFLCGIVRVLVRPDCHQNSHQNLCGEAWLQGRQKPVAVLGLSVKSFSARSVRD